MATRKFDCDSCGNYGKISITETDYVTINDIVYCPICGADISVPDDEDDEETEY